MYFPEQHGATVGTFRVIGVNYSPEEIKLINELTDVSLTYCRENTTVDTVIEKYDRVFVQFFPKNCDKTVLEKVYERGELRLRKK